MADESAWTAHDILELYELRAAECFSCYVTKPGGLYRARQQAELAAALGIYCDIGGSIELGIGNAANLHLGAALAQCRAAERLPGDEAGGRRRARDRRRSTTRRHRHRAVPVRGRQGDVPRRSRSRGRGRHREARPLRGVRAVALIGGGRGRRRRPRRELTRRGHEVRCGTVVRDTLAPFRAAGGVRYEGVLGDGYRPAGELRRRLGSGARRAPSRAGLPAVARARRGRRRAAGGRRHPARYVLNPGHTGGALTSPRLPACEARRRRHSSEFSTLTYVARKTRPASVRITGAAGRVRAACLPGGEAALGLAREALSRRRSPARDVLASAWPTSTSSSTLPAPSSAPHGSRRPRGDFRFYAEAMTPGRRRVDRGARRRASRGRRAPTATRCRPADSTRWRRSAPSEPHGGGARRPARPRSPSGEANRASRRRTRSTTATTREDFGYGLVPLLELAPHRGVRTPDGVGALALAWTSCWRAAGRRPGSTPRGSASTGSTAPAC